KGECPAERPSYAEFALDRSSDGGDDGRYIGHDGHLRAAGFGGWSRPAGPRFIPRTCEKPRKPLRKGNRAPAKVHSRLQKPARLLDWDPCAPANRLGQWLRRAAVAQAGG